MKAKWIWYYGDFELHHNILLHSRREDYGFSYPPFWPLTSPYINVVFHKTFHAPEDFVLTCRCKGQGFARLDGQVFLNINGEDRIPKGDHTIEVTVMNYGGLPCFYASGKHLVTDESWTATSVSAEPVSVGCTPEFIFSDDDPQAFPFAYKRIDPAGVCTVDGGLLYDFGAETFGKRARFTSCKCLCCTLRSRF